MKITYIFKKSNYTRSWNSCFWNRNYVDLIAYLAWNENSPLHPQMTKCIIAGIFFYRSALESVIKLKITLTFSKKIYYCTFSWKFLFLEQKFCWFDWWSCHEKHKHTSLIKEESEITFQFFNLQENRLLCLTHDLVFQVDL